MPSVVGIATAGVMSPAAGIHALWFLSAVPAGLLFSLIFRTVGVRVENLRAKYSADPGEVATGLLVIGHVQSPGLAILRSNELHLVPLAGSDLTIPLGDIRVLKEGRWLPGKYVWGKRAFTLGTPLKQRLAFAVPESIGYRWSQTFAAL